MSDKLLLRFRKKPVVIEAFQMTEERRAKREEAERLSTSTCSSLCAEGEPCSITEDGRCEAEHKDK
jgi:hypothetical protein